MTRARTSSNGKGPWRRPASAAGGLSLVTGLVWLLWSFVNGVTCAIAGRASGGAGDDAALVPPLVLCAAAVALWRRSPSAVWLLPSPLALVALVWAANLGAPSMFGGAACALFGAADFVTFLGGLVVPSLGALVLLVFEPDVARRGTESVASVFGRVIRSKIAWALLALAATWTAVLFVYDLLRPVPLEERGLEYASAESARYPVPTVPIFVEPASQDEPRPEKPPQSSLDSDARFWITRIQLSTLPGHGLQRLGSALDQRIGPVEWTSNPLSEPRIVSAVGHFPPEVYRQRYRDRLRAFEQCKDEVRSDERFIEEWSATVAGLLTPAEISWAQSIFKRDGFAVLRRYERQRDEFCSLERPEDVRALRDLWANREQCLEGGGDRVRCGEAFEAHLRTAHARSLGELLVAWERGTRDVLRPEERKRLESLLRRREHEVLTRTCDALFMNALRQSDAAEVPAFARAPVFATCDGLNPGSEEEFSRVAFQWQCAGRECRWSSMDAAAWQRVLPEPCHTTGPQACVDEAFDYLASGRVRGAR